MEPNRDVQKPLKDSYAIDARQKAFAQL